MTRTTIERTGEAVALTASMLGVALLFLVGTMRLTGEARIVPISVLVPLIPLLGYSLWRNLRSRPPGAPPPSTGPAGDRWVLGWILALPALVTIAGLLVGSALFVTVWLRRRSGERWVTSIASGVATAAALGLLGATVLEGCRRGGFFPRCWPSRGSEERGVNTGRWRRHTAMRRSRRAVRSMFVAV
jgi:hypothetical protein